MLHIVNKSPFTSAGLDGCLRVLQDGAQVLLIEDGIYAATAGTAVAQRLLHGPRSVRVCALLADVEARGMGDRLAAGVERVDYAGFVDLVTNNNTVHSWL